MLSVSSAGGFTPKPQWLFWQQQWEANNTITFVHVVLRHYPDGNPQWEAYGTNHPFYGSGDTATEARNDAREGAALLLDVDSCCVEFLEFQEYPILPETNTTPAVWGRILADANANRMLEKRKTCDSIAHLLRQHPEYVSVLSKNVGPFGDVVVTVTLLDEQLPPLLDDAESFKQTQWWFNVLTPISGGTCNAPKHTGH